MGLAVINSVDHVEKLLWVLSGQEKYIEVRYYNTNNHHYAVGGVADTCGGTCADCTFSNIEAAYAVAVAIPEQCMQCRVHVNVHAQLLC